MNRAEKRRHQKLAQKTATKAKRSQPSSRPETPVLGIRETVNLADQCFSSGRLPEAEAFCQSILKTNPNQPDALHILGMIACRTGKNEIAVGLIKKSLALKSDNVAAYFNLGIVLIEQSAWDEAGENFRKAISFKPDYAEAYDFLGFTLLMRNKLEEAVINCQKAIDLKPDFAKAHNNLGIALKEIGKFEEAVSSFEKALAIKPDLADAHGNLGAALEFLGRFDEAAASYRNAVMIKPDYAIAHWNLADYQLRQQDLRRGWEGYEWGLKFDGVRAQVHKLQCAVWQGEDLQGKSIFVYAEQGIGDEILFAGCIPDLVALSPQKLFLECAPRLEPLFKRSFPSVQVCGKSRKPDISRTNADKERDFRDLSWLGNEADLDYALPIGSLPKFFRNEPEDFPRRDAFLRADPEKQAALRARYRQRWPKKRLVGLSWHSGNSIDGVDRSLLLDQLISVLSHQGCQFINLQYGDVEQEISDFKAHTGLDIFMDEEIDPLSDIDAFAAQIAALDLVITIDNSTAHIAGALGVPTWILLPSNANWRWCLEDGGSSLWYASVHMYRQQNRGDWSAVIEQVCDNLTTNSSLLTDEVRVTRPGTFDSDA